MASNTTSDVRVLDFDVSSILKVNAVSVRAILRRRNGEALHFNPSRTVELQVALRAVDNSDVAHGNIVALVESYNLERQINCIGSVSCLRYGKLNRNFQ